MKQIFLIFKHELLSFFQSDRTTMISYVFLIVAWSLVLSGSHNQITTNTNHIWLVLFAVILSGNFATTALVAERLSGSIEIILTSGIHRNTFLIGKQMFVFLMSSCIGLICFGGSSVLSVFIYKNQVLTAPVFANKELVTWIILYVSACFMNTCCSSWFCFRIRHPKSIHFINLAINGVLIVVYSLAQIFFTVSPWMFVVLLLLIGGIGEYATFRDFKSERVIQPLEY